MTLSGCLYSVGVYVWGTQARFELGRSLLDIPGLQEVEAPRAQTIQGEEVVLLAKPSSPVFQELEGAIYVDKMNYQTTPIYYIHIFADRNLVCESHLAPNYVIYIHLPCFKQTVPARSLLPLGSLH